MTIQIKRAYEPASRNDGQRFLVERLWPRGIRKEDLELDDWLKDVAPSTELRRWFGHQPERWAEFQRRYRAELDAHPEAWRPLLAASRKGTVTLVYGARDTEHNSAAALRDYLTGATGRGRAATPARAATPKRTTAAVTPARRQAARKPPARPRRPAAARTTRGR
jgi:uncharacterized protein YeaO (DUF488 family)